MQKYLLLFGTTLVATVVIIPLLALVWMSFGEAGVWQHLVETVLGEYVRNSLMLMIGVATGTLILGVSAAYAVSMWEFPCRRVLGWSLLLPLAMPTYITAYAYTGLLDIAGPVQSLIRDQFSLSFGEYWFPEIRSISGAVIVFSLVLYPYIYLLVCAVLNRQSPNLRDSARLLGLSRRQTFWKLTLPLIRPAIVAGLALALMETLADFGAVSYFGINTFTTGIYRTWNGLGSASSAAQLSLILLTFIIVLLVMEKTSRRRASYADAKLNPIEHRRKISGTMIPVVLLLLFCPILFGFVIPATQLAMWAVKTMDPLGWSGYYELVWNSISVALVTAGLAALMTLIVLYTNRVVSSKYTAFMRFFVGLGYAVPGIVIAVATLIPLAYFDNQLDNFMRSNFDFSSGLLLSGSLFALILAYLVRFLTVSLNTIEPNLQRIPHSLDMTTRSLGLSAFGVLHRVHLPLIRPGMAAAMLMVFVEVMKELPATLVLRPFNFNTLAVRAYELASDERLPEAAMASLTIVLVGLLPVVLLMRLVNEAR
ncbi:MAG: iron ABC transporter permease [Pseudomonadota bacterium]